jgi:hypothetical protein
VGIERIPFGQKIAEPQDMDRDTRQRFILAWDLAVIAWCKQNAPEELEEAHAALSRS